jgi:hypothetical protein
LPTKNGKEIKHILKDNGKEINQELHTIPLLSRTLQFSTHQEWEGNKPRMAYFRKVWMSSKFAGSDGEQVQFAKDFEKLANLEEFLEYEDQLHLEIIYVIPFYRSTHLRCC